MLTARKDMQNEYGNSSFSHEVIPGGAHTNSKGDDQFPINAPSFLERGEGCYVWDNNGNKFLDWMMGLRSMSLGYGFKSVIDSAIAQILNGSNFGRPSFIETQTALRLLELIPKGDMVKFAKNGSTVTTAAVKLARAYTGRDYIALCKDQPFFSYDDWFIGTTPCNNGIPHQISELSLRFGYNDIQSLKNIFDQYPNKIAAVILEAATIEHPKDNFLHKVRELCTQNGTLMILDEMITGFRWHLNGAQTYYNIEPDLSAFGKGIANGFSLAALVGKREIMELGGLHHDKRRVFLISTTHGAENHALAAAQAVLQFYQENDVISHLWNIGNKIIQGMKEVITTHALQDYFFVGGIECSPYYICKDPKGNVSFEYRTLFLQEMIKQGVLFNYIAPSYSHNDAAIQETLDAVDKSLNIYKKAFDNGIAKYLEGPSIKPVFREYN